MIAVYVNEKGNVSSQREKGLICLYEKSADTWQRVREIPFDTSENNSIAGMRRTIIDMVQKLEGCKAFVASEVAGQLYYVLEANGFECFETEGKPEETLNSIEDALKQEQKQNTQKQPESEDYILPTKEPGVYFVDMKRALNLNCSLTSKKLLMPFLHKQEFRCLEILCDHVPRWFTSDLMAMKLQATIVKASENESRVLIKPM